MRTLEQKLELATRSQKALEDGISEATENTLCAIETAHKLPEGTEKTAKLTALYAVQGTLKNIVLNAYMPIARDIQAGLYDGPKAIKGSK